MRDGRWDALYAPPSRALRKPVSNLTHGQIAAANRACFRLSQHDGPGAGKSYRQIRPDIGFLRPLPSVRPRDPGLHVAPKLLVQAFMKRSLLVFLTGMAISS